MAINGISQMGQDPNVYAQQYANNNGLSLDDAKTKLKEQYGDPSQQQSGLGLHFGSQNSDVKPSSFNDPEFAVDSNFSIQGMFQNLLNILHGNGGPQKAGDPQKQSDTTTQLPSQGTDPNSYAQQYANENGLTLDDAKTELKSKYGDPQNKQGNTSTASSNSSSSSTKSTSSTSNKPDPSIDPNTYAQQYANENGLTLDEAKAELKSKYGDPQKPDNNSNTTANNKNKLPDQGTDPNSYAQEYADENGLTLDAAIEQLNELYGTPIQKNMFFNA